MTYEGSYRPGPWAVATTPNGWLLADLPVTDERIAAAWARLREGGDADQVLEALLERGLASLPGFALAVLGADTLRVVVRRDAVVGLRTGGEDRVVEARSGSWTDVDLPLPVDEIHLRPRSTDGSDTDTGVPVGLGIAQASELRLFLVGGEQSAPAPAPALPGVAAVAAEVSPIDLGPDPAEAIGVNSPEPATPEPTPEPATPEPATPEPAPEAAARDYSDLFAGTQDRDAFLARLAIEDSSAVSASEDADAALEDEPSGPPPVPSGTPPVAVGGEPLSEVTLAPPSGATASWTGEPSETAAGREEAAPASATPTGLIDALPWLRAETDHDRANPEPAAPPAPPLLNPPKPPPDTPIPPPGTPPPPPPPASPPASAPATSATPSGSVTPPPPTDTGEEAAALTMSRAELLAAVGNHGVVGPSVLAVRCPSGHLTPPEQDRCRVCREEVPPSEPGEVPRPTLGLLRGRSGETVTLDRDIIFGRSPQATASRAANQPHLVKVADPGVSRNHVHVALDGWQVLVRDLGSSNGTEIQLPGREVEKLRSGEDYLVEAGTVLTLAGDIQYTYEVTP